MPELYQPPERLTAVVRRVLPVANLYVIELLSLPVVREEGGSVDEAIEALVRLFRLYFNGYSGKTVSPNTSQEPGELEQAVLSRQAFDHGTVPVFVREERRDYRIRVIERIERKVA